MTYTTKIEIEICCEECQEAIHWHLEKCPICGATHAGTEDTASDPYSTVVQSPHLFRCSECKTQFRMLGLEFIPDDQLDSEPEYDHIIVFEVV